MTLSDKQLECLELIATVGATSVKKLDRQYGPGWRALVEAKMLRVVYTQGYGQVVALTKTQRDQYRRLGLLDRYPYISGPTSAANRALQNDLREQLEVEGYRWAKTTYKTSGLRDQSTDMIVSQTFRVPVWTAIKIESVLEPVAPQLPEREPWQVPILAALGYPRLYATVGVTGAQLTSWYKKEAAHIDTWRHPLMIGAPAETPDIRAAVRRIEAQWRRSSRSDKPRIKLITPTEH